MRINRRTWLRAVLAAIAWGGFVRPLAAQEAVGEVVRTQGHVSKTTGGASAVPLAVGASVAVGDTVVTADGAKVDLRFSDGSLLTVGPSSHVEVSRYAPEAGGQGDALLSLLSGIIKLIVNDRSRWSRFAVETETAVASVRGTEWLVDAAVGTTAVFVLRGTVEVAGRNAADGSVTLKPGEGTDVAESAAPTPPKLWGAKRRFNALTRVSW